MSNKSTTEDLAGTVAFVAAQAAKPNAVTLETPIKRGDQVITSLSLRKPAAGELRGVALADLLRLDVAALITLLPRITSPTLTAHEAGQLDLVDLTALGTEVLGFFVSKADKAALSPSPTV